VGFTEVDGAGKHKLGDWDEVRTVGAGLMVGAVVYPPCSLLLLVLLI